MKVNFAGGSLLVARILEVGYRLVQIIHGGLVMERAACGYSATLLLLMSSIAHASGAFIHDGSVRRTHQGIEATVTWAHDPVASASDPNRTFNLSTVHLVARCRDRTTAWKRWEQLATHSGREVVATTFADNFLPAADVEVLAPIVETLCTAKEYTSLPLSGRAIDGNLPPLTLVCSAGTQEPKVTRTYHVNFAEGSVNDTLAEISAEKIVIRYATDSGTRLDEIDRFSGMVTMSIRPNDGSTVPSISGPCEKKESRAF